VVQKEPLPLVAGRRKKTTSSAQPALSNRRAWQEAMHQQVQALYAQGETFRAIAKQLKMNTHTVSKYAHQPEIAEQGYGRRSSVEPYRHYLEQRWAQGCTQVKQLWQELQAHGFRGSYKSVWALTRSWPLTVAAGSPTTAPGFPAQTVRTARQAMWLLMLAPECLNSKDTAYREALCRVCPYAAIV